VIRPSALSAVLVAALALACQPDQGGEVAPEPPPPLPEGPRTVVVVSLDTLRPDRLGVYGGRPEVSPFLDELAQEAVVYEQALTASPWTLPSHMTMLTGLDPVTHGVLNNNFKLSPNVVTLAEVLTEAGYTTAAFTDGGFVSGWYGFEQGFDHFDHERDNGPGTTNGFPRIMPTVLDWLEGTPQIDERVGPPPSPDGDLFLFLHTFDAHTPYDEVAPDILETFRQRSVKESGVDARLNWARHLMKQDHVGVTDYLLMEDLLNDYDAGIREADLWLSLLADQLKAMGRWDGTLLIVTSDHGEAFFDHGLHVGHGLTLKDAEMAVPMIVRYPGAEAGGTRVPDLVGVVDVMRTVLEVEGLEVPAVTQGESLAGVVRGRERSVDFVLGESSNMRSLSITTNDYKYISPVGVKPLMIAERHLSPTSPAMLMGPREELVYTASLDGGATEVELRYDMTGDPLGLLDVLPSSHEFYDRADDPGELDNRYHDEAYRSAVRDMVRTFNRRVSESQAIVSEQEYRPDDYEPDKAQLRVLATLGYVESGDREELKRGRVSKAMQEWIDNPHVAPDTTLLHEGDRAVHRVRVQLASGGALQPGDGPALWAAGDGWLEWLAEHPRSWERVEWRLAELIELAEGAGLEPPSARWVESLGSLAR
jgi:arylsulfatase A-like enzyme